MNLEDLSKEDLILVTYLIIEGKSVDEAIGMLIPTNIRDLVNGFHSLYCKRIHKGDNCCDFYIEEVPNGKEHKYWYTVVADVISKFDMYEDVEVIIANIMRYLWEVEALKQRVEKEEVVGGLAIFNHLLNLNQSGNVP